MKSRKGIGGRKTKPFWTQVWFGPACWEWMGSKSNSGYGHRKHNGKASQAHRVSYEIEHGPIAAGLFVCHRCDNPRCVRPDHLFLGTHDDNMSDMAAKGRCATGKRNYNGKKTTCRRGHPLFEVRAYLIHGGRPAKVRRCRICDTANAAARYAKRVRGQCFEVAP